ncbi:FAD-dependent oxidoreductase [Amycolatopsis acidiphila]|uniref:Oxidoreductase n=1 Tax=Amycolatopsis acidiphila TaxID=715473 RepID=A0A558A800_9PSEU|nr:FAD-dependent oxidoreductase [Amycolatopsis acidiphila]TVT20394.1 oxidoreductase [Amycolatopsis acidiphila]UIJ59191.1 FAD-dependent oxidoreductase [Amycolatopsis acidiphila]GHG79042.1 ferredoxin reductase [Amycolatopsis acidiphila]
MRERVVIVGSSVGGIRTAQELRRLGFDDDIMVLGAEEELPYDKPPLTKQLLVGGQTEDQISLLGADGWDGIGVDGRLATAATAVDIDERTVTACGEQIDYDYLVIATGVRPRTLGTGVESVVSVRELRHARSLRLRLAGGRPVLVVGGGFIGAEVASSARTLGADVTIVEALAAPFARAVGAEVGGHLASLHRDNGVTLLTGVGVEAVEQTSEGAVVRLSDGTTHEAGTVVVGIGTTPNTEWLDGSRIPIDDGVLTDASCAVQAAEGVYAIGDVARSIDQGATVYRRVEHWTNAVEQAHIVAKQIIDPTARVPSARAPYFWSDQFGTKIQMVGRPAESDSVELRRFPTPAGEKTIAIYGRQGAFAACVTFGWPRAIATCRSAWERGKSTEHVLAELEKLSSGAPVGA